MSRGQLPSGSFHAPPPKNPRMRAGSTDDKHVLHYSRMLPLLAEPARLAMCFIGGSESQVLALPAETRHIDQGEPATNTRIYIYIYIYTHIQIYPAGPDMKTLGIRVAWYAAGLAKFLISAVLRHIAR